ncbi:MAG: 7-carboxy-7-deazaguanine synthase QueE [Gammaproteobacteria bacterium]|nr:MAG: 7-carboxy-7-deazaguanine synthase QueE [Gammaproteobacteria bacterium]
MAAADQLKVTEIFRSLQGESLSTGWPTVFVRLTGCPLRCRWCDTEYAFTGGSRYSIADILAEVAALETRHVCVTGGEPLAQPACRTLLAALCEAGHEVSLETSGALDIGGLDPRVRVVMDLKAPGSGEAGRNRLDNLALLRPQDELKCVLADRADFDWAVATCQEHDLFSRCTVSFSPVQGELEPAELADWILSAGIPVRFQIQLHKLLWGDRPGV